MRQVYCCPHEASQFPPRHLARDATTGHEVTFASLLLAAGAPITYVSAQLGHATPTTTLPFYAKWIPSKGRRWVEVLDRAELRDEVNFGTKIWNRSRHNAQVVPQAVEKPGEPSGTRTRDPPD